jgi:quercetin dioxygenase-like cupin family protein
MTTIPFHIADKSAGEWKEHPRFRGVLLKPLLTRADNPHANINVVRVPPGCAIGDHTHDTQVETIYVLAGKCLFTISGIETPFEEGQVVAAPAGVKHSLRNTGVEDVELLTIFTPPQG